MNDPGIVGNFKSLFDREASAASNTLFVSQDTLKAFHLMDHSKSGKHDKNVANCR